MAGRPKLKQWDRSSANDQDIPRYDLSADEWKPTSIGVVRRDIYQMDIVGNLKYVKNILPVSRLGPEIVAGNGKLTRLRGKRGISGVSGTTTVELEVNGTGTGDTLSWVSTDPDYMLKSVTIDVDVIPGDLLSLKLISVEDKAVDVFVEASE